MNTLVEAILFGKNHEASKLLENRMVEILEQKLHEVKKMVASKCGLNLDEDAKSYRKHMDFHAAVNHAHAYASKLERMAAKEPERDVAAMHKRDADSMHRIADNLRNGRRKEASVVWGKLDTATRDEAHPKLRSHLEEEFVEEETIAEGNVQRMGRVKLIKARVRNGKIQRRKKLSAVKGYTLRGGKLVRMSAAEKQRRKLGARRGKVKRRAKKAQMLRKRKRSLMKRKALGLK